jgi:phosphate starvation-inducible protein PhoH and related proteins
MIHSPTGFWLSRAIQAMTLPSRKIEVILLSEIILTVDSVDLVELYGENNAKLNLLRKAFPDVAITSRGNSIKLTGEKKFTQKAKDKFEMMVRLLQEHEELPMQMVEDLLSGTNPFETRLSSTSSNKTILYGREGRPIKAKTRNQKKLIEASENNDIVFAVGPAGTGKTYTAVALAVRALKNRQVKKIILTRPAVEAGESLGFLPGDLKEKIDPYLRPLYDALDDMLPMEKLQQFMANRIIEIAPLAFMRGRTLDNAFIILDEAQNCSTMQLKMFLTRLGPSAQCIITGDLSQIDLPFHQKSGLRRAIDLLEHLEGIQAVYLDAEDVVRHRLVKEIIRAYEKSDEEMREKNKEKEGKKEAPALEAPALPTEKEAFPWAAGLEEEE